MIRAFNNTGCVNSFWTRQKKQTKHDIKYWYKKKEFAKLDSLTFLLWTRNEWCCEMVATLWLWTWCVLSSFFYSVLFVMVPWSSFSVVVSTFTISSSVYYFQVVAVVTEVVRSCCFVLLLFSCLRWKYYGFRCVFRLYGKKKNRKAKLPRFSKSPSFPPLPYC